MREYGRRVSEDLPPAVADAYRDSPSPQRETMLEMRRRILAVIPEATETIKYGMPTFVHEGVAVAGLLAHRNHVGLYPYSGSTLSRLPALTQRYRTTKGALHLPVDEPMPADLLTSLIHQRLSEIPTSG